LVKPTRLDDEVLFKILSGFFYRFLSESSSATGITVVASSTYDNVIDNAESVVLSDAETNK